MIEDLKQLELDLIESGSDYKFFLEMRVRLRDLYNCVAKLTGESPDEYIECKRACNALLPTCKRSSHVGASTI